MKSVTVTLNFGDYSHCLWDAAQKNFIEEQPDRFALLEGEECKSGTMFFCERYLEAQFLMALEDGKGLYSDEDTGTFVVCSTKEFGTFLKTKNLPSN